MHSLYANEVTVRLKLAVISLNFILQHLKYNANPCVCSIALVSKIIYKFWKLAKISFWPFKLRFLSSAVRILSFRNNRMENKCRVVLKRCINVIGRNACALARLRDLQSKQRVGSAFLVIFVEMSRHEQYTVWKRSKLKNKIWHSGYYRRIAWLKITHKQVKIRLSVIYRTTRNTLKEFLQFLPRFSARNAMK